MNAGLVHLAAVDPDRAPRARFSAPLDLGAEVGDRWPATSADSPGVRRNSPGGRRRRLAANADGDEHHAEVHDHAAVGPTDEAAPALAAGGEHELAQRGTGGEPAEAEREQRGEARGRRAATASTSAAGAGPRRPEQPRGAAARADALRHGSTGATAMRNSSARPIGIVMRSKYGRADRDAVAVERLDEQREHRAEQHDERERGEQHVVGEERALARDGESMRPGERRRSPRQPMSPTDDDHDQREEARAASARSSDSVNACTESSTPERVRNVPRMVSANVAHSSERFQTRSIPRRSCTITECR